MKTLIGLTGRTGSGKSSAAQIFERLGAFVADCDKIAHETLQSEYIKEKLASAFTHKIFDENGEINRKALGEIVFSDSAQLKKLNEIMHKAIVERCIELCQSSGKDICVMDGSELEESGADEKCDFIVVITADEDKRLSRIMLRDNIDLESARRRMNAQNEYSKKAIFIENNGSRDSLEKEIIKIYNKISGEINA